MPPSNQASFPYCQSDCRLELYKTMLVLACEPHPEGRVPIALAKKIFAFGSRDHNAEVSVKIIVNTKFCRLSFEFDFVFFLDFISK